MREMFQSSPALKSGCYLANKKALPVGRAEFQSSPALKSGCYPPTRLPAFGRPQFVSILTRPEERVLR